MWWICASRLLSCDEMYGVMYSPSGVSFGLLSVGATRSKGFLLPAHEHNHIEGREIQGFRFLRCAVSARKDAAGGVLTLVVGAVL
jgi:hypothetical protein